MAARTKCESRGHEKYKYSVVVTVSAWASAGDLFGGRLNCCRSVCVPAPPAIFDARPSTLGHDLLLSAPITRSLIPSVLLLNVLLSDSLLLGARCA